MKEASGKKPTKNELLDRLLAEMDDEEEDGSEGQSSSTTEAGELPNETVNKKHIAVRARRSLTNFVANRL